MKELALVGLNNSHPFLFGGLVNGGKREKFVANSPGWTHSLFPDHDWEGAYIDKWRFTKAWARDPRFARAVAEAVLVDKVCDTLEEAAESTEGAFVCDMWGEYHRKQALAFLERGKPVFVDKPLAESVADAEVMIRAAKDNGTTLSTCSSLRFDPDLRKLKRKIEKELGRPSIVTVCCPCYQDLARYSVHGIEILIEVTGGATVGRVKNIGTGTRRHLILVEFVDGSCGVIHSWENHAYSVTVTGENGQGVGKVGVIDSFKPMVEAVLDSFVTNLPVVNYDEALEVVKVIEAGVRSRAADGEPVDLASS